jgi:hypothetical protein
VGADRLSGFSRRSEVSACLDGTYSIINHTARVTDPFLLILSDHITACLAEIGMYEERLDHLLESWKKAFGQYPVEKSKAEAAVVRWEWTTWERYSALPFHFKRFPGRGRVLKERPNTAGNFILYGFDQNERIQLHRFFQFFSSPPESFFGKLIPHPGLTVRIYSETFYRYSDNQIESIEFSVSPHIPLSIKRTLSN